MRFDDNRTKTNELANEHLDKRGPGAHMVAAAIIAVPLYELASAVSDIGPAIKELASKVDHSRQLGDLATAVDDLSQSVARTKE